VKLKKGALSLLPSQLVTLFAKSRASLHKPKKKKEWRGFAFSLGLLLAKANIFQGGEKGSWRGSKGTRLKRRFYKEGRGDPASAVTTQQH